MKPALPPNDTRLNTRFFLRWREVGADGTGKMHYPAQKQSIQDCKSMKPPQPIRQLLNIALNPYLTQRLPRGQLPEL